MAERQWLGQARLKNEGESARVDHKITFNEQEPRGAGQTMRRDDLAQVWVAEGIRWHIVRDRHCSYDIDDEEAAVWTLSLMPGVPGWETDSGAGGYGLIYADAKELADAANIKIR